MRSMCELINLFVDRKITTEDEATALLFAEASSIEEHQQLRKSIAATVSRLCPPSQAEPILALIMPPQRKKESQ